MPNPLVCIMAWTLCRRAKVRRIDTKAIKHSLDNHHIVIANSIDFSATGGLFNLDALDVATHIATSLVADKLIILDKSLTDSHGSLIKELTATEAHEPIETSTLAPTLTHAIHACQHGVGRVQLIDFDKDDALLGELFTTDGHGTMISQTDYDHCQDGRHGGHGGNTHAMAKRRAIMHEYQANA